jgi:hypothetical protein
MMRPCPPDFAEVEPPMSRAQLAKHYRASNRAILRWAGEVGAARRKKGPSNPINLRLVPEGFAEVAPLNTKAQLGRIYKASHLILSRWLKEAGVTAMPGVSSAPGIVSKMGRARQPSIALTRTTSMYDDAADTLRRERFMVNRCDLIGKFSLTGRYWRVGNSVLTGDELLARVARYLRRAA